MIYRQKILGDRPIYHKTLSFKLRENAIFVSAPFFQKIRRGSVLTTDNRSSRLGGSFGLKSARLGFLLAQQGAGVTDVSVDPKLMEEGYHYLTALVEAIKILNKEVDYDKFSFHQDSLLIIENGAERIQSLGSSEVIEKMALNIKAIIEKKKVNQEDLNSLADIFLKISDLSIENESAKYFSATNHNDFRFFFK